MPLLLAVVLSLVLSACNAAGPTAIYDLSPGDEVMRYDRVPFPNDLYLSEAEGVGSIRIDGLASTLPFLSSILTQAFEKMDGFGTTTTVTFRFDGPLLASSLPAGRAETAQEGSSVFLVRLGTGERVPVDLRYVEEARTLMLLPPAGAPLRPKTRYAAVVTTKVRGLHPLTAVEGPVSPSPDMRAILDPASHPTSDSNLARAQALYGQPLEELLQLPDIGSLDDIAAVTVFTTQATTDALVAIRGQLEQAASPGVRFDRIWSTPAEFEDLFGQPIADRPGLDNPGGIAHGNISLAATGHYTTVWYKTPAVEEDPIVRALARLFLDVHDDARFVMEAGMPVPQGTRDVPFAIAVPRSPPAGQEDFPLVIYQHGLGGSRAEVYGVANTLCGAGYVVVGIDAVGQGMRYSGKDLQHNFTGAAGSDGFADADPLSMPLGVFEGFMNALALRDNIRQTVVDLMQLVCWLRDPATDLAAIGSPSLDPDQLYYVGKSLGSLVGVPFLAVEPMVRDAIVSVGGGGLANELLVNSPTVGGPAFPIFSVLFGIPGWCPDRYDPILNLAQAIADAGDAVNYARHVIHEPLRSWNGAPSWPKSLLCTQVMGDEFIPAASTEALALAMGVPLASPLAAEIEGMDVVPSPVSGNLRVGRHEVTGALVQYNPASHGMMDIQVGTLGYVPGFPHPCPDRFPKLEEPLEVENPVEEAQAQMLHFLETARTDPEGVPEIVVTAPPDPF